MPNICWARQPLNHARLPRPWLFLAGPTPRHWEDHPSWRRQAIPLLNDRFGGTLVIPEDEDRASFGEQYYDKQVPWEWRALDAADAILFWVPRNMNTLPGLTTNIEFGYFVRSGKIVLGYPPEAEHCGYLGKMADRFGVLVCDNLLQTCLQGARLAETNSALGYSTR